MSKEEKEVRKKKRLSGERKKRGKKREKKRSERRNEGGVRGESNEW